MPKSNVLPTKPLPHPHQYRQHPYPQPQGNSQSPYQPPTTNHHQQPYPQPHSSSPPPAPYQRSNTTLLGTTDFPPPSNFTFRCPDPRYPQFTLSSHELSQSVPEFIDETLAKDRANKSRNAARTGVMGQGGVLWGGDILVSEGEGGDDEASGNIEARDVRRRGKGGADAVRVHYCGRDTHTLDSTGATRGREGARGGLKNGSGVEDGGQDGRVKVGGANVDRTGSRNSVSHGGRVHIPGTGSFQVSLRAPEKEIIDIIDINDDGCDKEPHATPKPDIGGNNDKGPVDSPFKDDGEPRNEILIPESPTPSLINNGWPPRPNFWNLSPDLTTSCTPSLTEGKKPRPPPPWLPPIKESEGSAANVELTAEQQDAKYLEDLKPVIELNARTPWSLPFHEQPLPQPAWHAICPDGYKPTPFTGFPLRRPSPLWLPAAHDPDKELDRFGHWCLDVEDEWDRCVMGKCAGCVVCQPDGA